MELVASAAQPLAGKQNKAQLSGLSRQARNGLFWIAFLFTLIQTQAGFFLMLTIYGSGALICALVANTGRRWAPLPGAIWCIILVGILRDSLLFDLTHPIENRGLFVFSMFLALGFIIAILAGIAAAAQHYWRAPTERRAPRWASFAVNTLVGFAVGGIVVAAAVPAQTQIDLTRGLSPEALAKLPSLTTAYTKFTTTEVHAKAGELVALRLDNQDGSVHSFDIDEFDVHAPIPAQRSGLALFMPTKAGSYRFYCSIPGHAQFMSGTLIVDP
jgi:uncharacterized cupredoxin-like copper-binding protein